MDRKIITIGSPESGEKKFKVEIGNGGLHSQPFCVYAWHEQDALDAAVDYCEQAGWDGLFWDDDESVQEYPDDFVTAGNHSHLLRSDCFHVTQLNETKRNKKNTIRLTESDLKRVISESVKRVLEENKYLNKVKIIIRDKNEEPVFCKEIPYDDYEQYYSDWKRCCVNGAFITVEDNYDQGYLQSSKNDDKGVKFFGDPDHPSHYGKTPYKIYGI